MRTALPLKRVLRACPLLVSAFVALASLFLAPNARADQASGILTGVVSDSATRKPLAEVIVTVTSPSLQGEETVVTDNSGYYRVPNLPPGIYAIRFDRQDYLSNAQDGLSMRADITLRVNAQLASEAQKTENVVINVRPTVDVGSSSTGSNLNADFIHRVPVAAPGGKGAASRSFESVAAAAPGAHSDNYGTSISGTTSLENRYVLDGLSVSNPGFGTVGTPLSTEFVEEVNVVSGGYLPEHGRTSGGVLSVVTKSGSNKFEATAFSYVSPGSLEGKRKTVPPEGKTVAIAPSLSYIADAGVSVGGPIIKDKLWFFAGMDVSQTKYNIRRSLYHDLGTPATETAEAMPDYQEIGGTTKHYTADLRTVQGMGKLTYAINQDQKLTLAFYAAPTTSGGRGKFSLDPQSGSPEIDQGSDPGQLGALAHKRTARPVDVSLKWNSEYFGKKLSLDVIAGIHNEKNQILASDGSGPGQYSGIGGLSNTTWSRTTPGPHSISDFMETSEANCTAADGRNICPVPTYISGGPGDLRIQTFTRYQTSAVATYLLNLGGHHVLKAGYDAEVTTFAHNKGISGTRFLHESEDGQTFLREWGYGVLTAPDKVTFLDPYPTHSRSISAGGFAQDSWSILDKVTVNFGARYDSQFLYAGNGQLGLALPNEWSPRLGVIFDPTQSGRSKLFANYARYYQTVSLDLADVTLAGDPHPRVSITCNPLLPVDDQGACKDPANFVNLNAPNSPKELNDIYSPNKQWLQVGGGKTAIDPKIKAPSTDEIVLGGEYDLLADNRVGFTYTRRWMNSWIEDMSRDNTQSYFYGNPGKGIASDFGPAIRKYDAATLFWSKAFSHNWLAQASYTLAYLRGNIQGLFTNGQDLAPNHLGDFDVKSIIPNRNGALPGDRRHTFKIFAAKDWVLSDSNRFVTGIGLHGSSGEPTNYFGKDPIGGDDAAFLIKRGTGPRLPWEYSADIQLGYRFMRSDVMTLSLTVDIFNALNFQANTAIDQTYTQSNVHSVQGAKVADLESADGKTIKLQTVDGMGTAEKNGSFQTPNAWQDPRVFRFGVRGEF